MRRSGWLKVTIAVQLFYSILLGSLALYLVFLSHFWETLPRPRIGDATMNLIVPSALLAAPALLGLVGWLGLRKRKLWGWWLALLAGAGMLGMLVDSLIEDGWENFDWYMVALTVASAMVTILLLSPMGRKFYWQVAKLQSADLTS
jgi:hypothetical protein